MLFCNASSMGCNASSMSVMRARCGVMRARCCVMRARCYVMRARACGTQAACMRHPCRVSASTLQRTYFSNGFASRHFGCCLSSVDKLLVFLCLQIYVSVLECYSLHTDWSADSSELFRVPGTFPWLLNFCNRRRIRCVNYIIIHFGHLVSVLVL